MARPSLYRWLNRWFWGGLLTLSLFAFGLTVVNIVDGLPFWLAVRRAHQLDPARLQELAAICSRYEKSGHRRWLGKAIPSEFRALKPVRVSIYPGCSDISLFEHMNTPRRHPLSPKRYGGQAPSPEGNQPQPRRAEIPC